MEQLKLRCRCGQVSGVAQVSADSGTHIVCYCDDCQAFANHLQRSDTLDSHGGSAIFQMAPARLKISAGQDGLRCLRLSPKGMFRWYTDCCRTPVANTAGRIPFVGLFSSFMDFGALQRDAVLGKPTLVQGRFAIGGMPERAHPTAPSRFVVRVVSRLAGWWLTGKGQPSPFVDEQYQPRVNVYVLTPEERAASRPASASSQYQPPKPIDQTK